MPTPFLFSSSSHCSATPVGTRFLTTVLGATEDTSSTDQEEPVTSSPPDVYYEGLVGGQPINDDDAEVNKFTDYPINLPSYLLLCLATVGSIAFTGSIFEVIGKHPQVRTTNISAKCSMLESRQNVENTNELKNISGPTFFLRRRGGLIKSHSVKSDSSQTPGVLHEFRHDQIIKSCLADYGVIISYRLETLNQQKKNKLKIQICLALYAHGPNTQTY